VSDHTPALIHTTRYGGGHQRIYRFANGYGASVVTSPYARGGQELAVLRFLSDSVTDFDLAYDTPVTEDVLGHLSDGEVDWTLDQIAALPEPHP
jgi:hypothetical protein